MLVIDSAMCTSAMAQASPILGNITSTLILPPRSPQPSENPHTSWPRELWLNSHYQQPGKMKHCTWKASAITSKPLSQPPCQSGSGSSGREQTAGEKAGRARFAFALFVAMCVCIHFIATERGQDTLLTWLKFWTFIMKEQESHGWHTLWPSSLTGQYRVSHTNK